MVGESCGTDPGRGAKKLPLFTDCKESDGEVSCPGDSGYSVIPIFGKSTRLRKDSPEIMLMGCLDELTNVANSIRLSQSSDDVAAIAAIVMGLSMQLNAYLVQGTVDRLSKVKIVETILESKIEKLCENYKGPVGWVLATTPEVHAADSIRVKLRECGRIASSLVGKYDKANDIVRALNHADKLVAQSMYCLGGRVFKSIDDLVGALLSSIIKG